MLLRRNVSKGQRHGSHSKQNKTTRDCRLSVRAFVRPTICAGVVKDLTGGAAGHKPLHEFRVRLGRMLDSS